ncbi:hypothetical protein D5086_004776 [Populus alba]|uniref:Uncharacterized protein n=1 Tax=Populus alba TaxID=43335 RepID=A0ACC4CSR2_POPAL
MKGREDDNIETIRKRFNVFLESSLPVVEYYESKGKVRKVDAAKSVEEVFEAVKAIFTPKEEKIRCECMQYIPSWHVKQEFACVILNFAIGYREELSFSDTYGPPVTETSLEHNKKVAV